MNFTETDYQRVAEYLDGAKVDLTADQRELLGHFQADEGRLRLDVTVPAAALHRASQRLAGAGHTEHHRAWWRWGSAAAAAMVAAMLLSSQLPVSTSGLANRPVSADEYVRAFLHEGGGDFRDQTSSLSERLLDYEVDWAMNTPWTVDLSVGVDADNEAADEPTGEMPSQEPGGDPDLIE